jgi:hypothetical protein
LIDEESEMGKIDFLIAHGPIENQFELSVPDADNLTSQTRPCVQSATEFSMIIHVRFLSEKI